MRLMYTKPKLIDLSQGSRMAFIRQFRQLTQDEIAYKVGVEGVSKRKTFTNYEKSKKSPHDDRLSKIAKELNVSLNAIRKYDFKDPIDFIYILMWIEEIYPNYKIDLPITYYTEESFIIDKFLKEWKEMKIKREKRKISYEEYIEWKINYEIKGVRK